MIPSDCYSGDLINILRELRGQNTHYWKKEVIPMVITRKDYHDIIHLYPRNPKRIMVSRQANKVEGLYFPRGNYQAKARYFINCMEG